MTVENILDNLVWLGHDSFFLDFGKTFYIDPFQIQDTKEADYIFITHPHSDHCSPEDIAKIQTSKTVIITEKESSKMLSGDIRIVEPGDRIDFDGISVQAVAAYNTHKAFHPKEKGWLGFILSIGGIRLYHAGDTDLIPEMNGYETDIALLPISGKFTMDAKESADAALVLQPRAVVPMHWGSFIGTEEDLKSFSEKLHGKIPVRVLQKQ